MLYNWYQNILINNIYKYFILLYFILLYFYINWNEEKLIIFIIIFCLYIFTFNFSFSLYDLYKSYIRYIYDRLNKNNSIHQENLFNWVIYLNNFKIYFQYNLKKQLNKFFVLIYIIIFTIMIKNFLFTKNFLFINSNFLFIFFNKYCLKFFKI